MNIEFATKVPKAVAKRTEENMTKYNMALYDAFNEAARHYCGNHVRRTKLYLAWYNSDYREFIPSVYREDRLDFKKYPLPY